MLKKLILRNFKCFELLELRLSSLTLLCGLNGIGKSSVIQALLVLRQSVASGELRRGGRLALRGELVDLGVGDDVLHENAVSDVVEFEIHYHNRSPVVLAFDCLKADSELTTRERLTESDFSKPQFEMPPLGPDLIYISAERLGPRKFYDQSKIHARRAVFGAHSKYAMNYLQDRQDELFPRDDPRCCNLRSRRMMNIVDYWLQYVTPSAHLKLETITQADAITAGFAFDRSGDVRSRSYRATNVGFGLSYILPVLVALLSPRGTLCLIENPEAHLHPRAQTKLAELAVRSALAGVQVIVETHSDHFMDGVRIAIRNSLIDPNCVAIHYFFRENSKSIVSSPKVDADGRLSSWPDGFFDQHEDNLIKLLEPRT